MTEPTREHIERLAAMADEDGPPVARKIDDGGPAFPRNAELGYRPHDGMSLRDYFAGQALAGLLANPNIGPRQGMEAERAAMAYAQADAMLVAHFLFLGLNADGTNPHD